MHDEDATVRSATIAIYSVKGGVGKTTLSANLAWISATTWNRSTLLWDLDASGGSTFLYSVEPRKRQSAEGVFAKAIAAQHIVKSTAYPNLDVLPADESIRALDAQLLRLGKRRRLAKLTQGLADRYQRIVLDCPPVMNELSGQVLRASDLVIVPLPPSPLSMRALDAVVREIAGATRHHPPLLPVLSMLDLRRSLHRQAHAANPTWPVVPYASAVEQCATLRRPLGAFAPQSAASQAFNALWDAVERKLLDGRMTRDTAGQNG